MPHTWHKGSSCVSWRAVLIAACVLVSLPACLGRPLQGDGNIYEDGDIDPEWSDWSFGYVAKNKSAVYDTSSNTRKAYCIDIQRQYGAVSFATTTNIPIDNSTVIEISLRRNGTSSDTMGAEDLSSLKFVLEGVSKDIAFMTDPISILEIIGNGPGSEDTVKKFLDGDFVELSVNTADLLSGMADDGQAAFSQISIGSCLSSQDSTCLAKPVDEDTTKNDSLISLCIGSMSLV